jgi:hypothetical protein
MPPSCCSPFFLSPKLFSITTEFASVLFFDVVTQIRDLTGDASSADAARDAYDPLSRNGGNG